MNDYQWGLAAGATDATGAAFGLAWEVHEALEVDSWERKEVRSLVQSAWLYQCGLYGRGNGALGVLDLVRDIAEVHLGVAWLVDAGAKPIG